MWDAPSRSLTGVTSAGRRLFVRLFGHDRNVHGCRRPCPASTGRLEPLEFMNGLRHPPYSESMAGLSLSVGERAIEGSGRQLANPFVGLNPSVHAPRMPWAMAGRRSDFSEILAFFSGDMLQTGEVLHSVRTYRGVGV